MRFTVLTTVVLSRDLKALVRRYEQTEDIRAAYIHVLRVLETTFQGSGGLSTCRKNANSRTLPSKQDPPRLLDDMISNCVRFDRMSPHDPLASIVMSFMVVCAIKYNPLYSTIFVLQRDFEDVDFDGLRQRILDYHYGA